jgi:signal transduction histidine kinase
MDDEIRARIFDPFYTTKFTGRGLGLAAAAGIVRAHRGGMIVTSAPEQGSVFQVFLPVVPADLPQPEPGTLPESVGVVAAT